MEEKNKKKKVGRPSFTPSEEKRLLVKELSGVGIPQEQIASILGISDDTLRKHFEPEIFVGRAEAHAKMAQAIYKKALSGSEKIMMFYAKTQMKWKETDGLEITGANGGPLDINVSSMESMDKLLAGMRKDED